ncbi:helix-turn-helix domain-containing protein [Actinokineospora sp. NPDC004072]
MRDAFASRDMGAVVRAYRYHPAHGHKPLPQQTVSRWLRITQSQLSRIESGRNKVGEINKLEHYAKVLKMPADLLWFRLAGESSPLASRPSSGHVLALPEGPVVPAATRAESAIADCLARTLDDYAATDNLAGPRSLLAIAPRQLRFVEELLLKARGKDRARLLRVAARFSEFVGWLSQDAGDVPNAMSFTSMASDYAEEAGDDILSRYILMRRSNIATDAERYDLALRLADGALAGVDGREAPRMRALALRQQAHVYAKKGDSDACARALEEAYAMAGRTVDAESELGSYCTPEFIEMEAAVCWVELGSPRSAITSLRRGLSAWRPEFRRDLGLCLARLAFAHAADSQPDHATQVVRSAVGIAVETRSHRTEAQLVRVIGTLRSGGAENEARQVGFLLENLAIGVGGKGEVRDHGCHFG